MERWPQFFGGRGPHHLGFSVQYDAWLPPFNHSGHRIIVRLPLRRQSSALGSADIRRTKNLRGTRHVDLDQRVAGSEAASLAHVAQGKFRTTSSPWLVPRFGGVAPSSERLSPGHEGLSWLKHPNFPLRRRWKNCAAPMRRNPRMRGSPKKWMRLMTR